MTAIKKYRRLEAKGLWIDAKQTNPKEVIVSIGKASIIISDKNEVPLDHWNFNSIVILKSGDAQIIVSPGLERTEKLIIKDDEMVNAITIICDYGKVPNSIIKSTHSIKIILLCIITMLFFYFPSIVRNMMLDIIKPANETILIKNLLEKQNLLGKSCKKQKETIKFEEKIKNNFQLKTGIDISITNLSLPSPLILPGGKIVIPFNWFDQKESYQEFVTLLNIALKYFEERKVFIRFLKEQKLSTLFAYILGLDVIFNLTPEFYHLTEYSKVMPTGNKLQVSDEQWLNIRNACLN